MESFVWTGRNQTFTYSARTIGGPPNGVWRRNGVVIESDNLDFTITFELDKNDENFLYKLPYTSRLRANGPTEGVFTYTVTNRVTPRIFTDSSMLIEGIYTVK